MDVDIGLIVLKLQVFDVVLFDYELGGCDGIEIFIVICNNWVYFNYKMFVVLLIGYVESYVVKEVVMVGVNGYLVKLVMLEVFGQCLCKVIVVYEEMLGGNLVIEVVWCCMI